MTPAKMESKFFFWGSPSLETNHPVAQWRLFVNLFWGFGSPLNSTNRTKSCPCISLKRLLLEYLSRKHKGNQKTTKHTSAVGQRSLCAQIFHGVRQRHDFWPRPPSQRPRMWKLRTVRVAKKHIFLCATRPCAHWGPRHLFKGFRLQT